MSGVHGKARTNLEEVADSLVGIGTKRGITIYKLQEWNQSITAMKKPTTDEVIVRLTAQLLA